MFGEEDALNMRPFTTSVRCISSKGTIKSIKIDEFVQLLSKDQKTWKLITHRVQQKDRDTMKKISEYFTN